MKFFSHIPNSIIGIFLIAIGSVLLLNTLGIATEFFHTLILLGSISIIIVGIYLANIHIFIYRLLTKSNNNDQPKE